MTGLPRRILAVLALIVAVPAAHGEPLTVAVASNFRLPAAEIAERYTAETGQDVRLSPGSTGKLYAQIVNGAPYDVFLAADRRRPALLEEAGRTMPGSRRTYAVGRLVLWSRNPEFADADCRARLADPAAGRLAIANPEIAPYGSAARQFLVAAGLWQQVESRVVYGESIAQALAFAATGNASFGLIAQAQARDPRLPPATCHWLVPAALHEPIAQDAVALQRDGVHPAAAGFVAFLGGSVAAGIIERYGYEAPR
ncbi:MAG: molybdate ABC transporter substrate-binding protein [Woeseiaceae bacterium]|nr:molybdate ABC transporter substrate-binding protein [Woeseiaceae bacterium]